MPASKKKITKKLKQKEKKIESTNNVLSAIPEDANDFEQTLDSISNKLNNMSSLGTSNTTNLEEDDAENDGTLPSQLGNKKFGGNSIDKKSKIQKSKKFKDKKKKNLEKALEYKERLDTTIVKDLMTKIKNLPEEKQKVFKKTNKKK
ncbi:hypothetical protein ABK040_016647 [Willaertia magna]